MGKTTVVSTSVRRSLIQISHNRCLRLGQIVWETFFFFVFQSFQILRFLFWFSFDMGHVEGNISKRFSYGFVFRSESNFYDKKVVIRDIKLQMFWRAAKNKKGMSL